MNNPMIEGRQADSARRRQRVVKAITESRTSGGEISVSAIARIAGVDRTFPYRHRDLLALIHAAQADLNSGSQDGSLVSRASLHADLANAQNRLARQSALIKQLERKLSEMLGEQAWRDSGIGAPTDIEQLQRRIIELEQQMVELTGRLEEQEQELDAARAANRQMFADVNKRHAGT